jgi:hypothetical protein
MRIALHCLAQQYFTCSAIPRCFLRHPRPQISFLGVKSGHHVGLTTPPPSVSRLSRKMGASTSRNSMGLQGLLQGCWDSFTFFFTFAFFFSDTLYARFHFWELLLYHLQQPEELSQNSDQATVYMTKDRFPAGARYFALLHSVHTGSGIHPASYAVDTGASFPGSNAARSRRWALKPQVLVLVCLATGPWSLPNWVSLFLETDCPGKVIMW